MIQVKSQNSTLGVLANNTALLSLTGISCGDFVLDSRLY